MALTSGFSTINVSPAQAQDTSFSEVPSSSSIGPAPVDTSSSNIGIINIGTSDGQPVTSPVTLPEAENAVVWRAMDSFDTGLKNALIKFIDTTKEGENLSSVGAGNGRTKKMDFQFYGTPSIAISPGALGVFSILFSYPPGANVASTGTAPLDTSAPQSTGAFF